MLATLRSSTWAFKYIIALSCFSFFCITNENIILSALPNSDPSSAFPPSQFSNGTTTSDHVCAPWLKNREVLFVRVQTMNLYYKAGRGGGENYVTAAIDWALRQNGFKVKTSILPLNTFSSNQLQRYHRIFENGVRYSEPLYNHPELICKMRPLHFWGNWKGDQESDVPYDPRQIVSPYPEDYNTFIGFFVHSLLWESKPQHTKQSNHGLIIGRSSSAITAGKHDKIVKALVDKGFILHSICRSSILDSTPNCGLPAGVVIHASLGPKEYSELMGEMAFLIGFGDPVVSPSPLEGLAHGAAWLNPIKSEDTKTALQQYPLSWKTSSSINTQHRPLTLLGSPYVYNIDLNNVSSVVEAAGWAVKYRFPSYTPWEFRPSAMIDRVCALMEDNSLCDCPNPTFGGFDGNSRSNSTGDSNLDCHASTYVRNPS